MHLSSRWVVIASLVATNLAFAAEQAPKVDSTLDVYTKPGLLVDIGEGRHLNLRCAGSGSPTVIFESGAIADSMAWYKVQPPVANSTRACAYDRAGYGFSDGGPLPRDVNASAEDLHALIVASHLQTPVVLVGHSLGTNIVRRYADAYPKDVAAIVLLDPPAQNIAEFSAQWQKTEDEGRAGELAAISACEQAAEKGQLDPPAPAQKDCLRGPNPQFSVALNAAQRAYKIKPAFWKTVLSVMETNGDLYRQSVSARENHGAIPLIVLEPDSTNADAPPADRKALDAATVKTHQLIAATSKRGKIMPVAHSSHDVQFDRPDAVVSAVKEAVDESRAHARQSPTH
jgi:pimeloyl-ACP methyl ester carboxylesterase